MTTHAPSAADRAAHLGADRAASADGLRTARPVLQMIDGTGLGVAPVAAGGNPGTAFTFCFTACYPLEDARATGSGTGTT